MPRPRKCRKVCQMPQVKQFNPAGISESGPAVVLTVDEYEAIRLIDKQGFSQEECSEYMQVARTTAQLIYNSARKKLADALVDGLPLKIEGGDYRLCDGNEEVCGCGGCRKHRCSCHSDMKEADMKEADMKAAETIVVETKAAETDVEIREEKTMRIAIPLDEDKQNVCIVLARAPFFLIREAGVDSIVENPAVLSNSGAGVEAAQFLVDNNIDVLITVRCGENAAEVFKEAGMKIYKSANKTASLDLSAYESGELSELTQFHGGYHGIR